MARTKKKRRQLGALGMERLHCTPETLSLRRVRLNAGGYNEDGRYFGRGEPLFAYHGSDPSTSNFGHLRATSRAAAKAKLKAKCPTIKFHR